LGDSGCGYGARIPRSIPRATQAPRYWIVIVVRLEISPIPSTVLPRARPAALRH